MSAKVGICTDCKACRWGGMWAQGSECPPMVDYFGEMERWLLMDADGTPCPQMDPSPPVLP